MAEGFTCAVDEEYRSACEGLALYGEHEGMRYCVLHFPGEEKKEDFEQIKESKLARQNYDFRGAIFPEGTSNFEGYEFDANVEFAGAAFSGERTDFTGAHFSGEGAFFTRAHFSAKETSFSGAAFSGERTSFSGAAFSGERTSFSRTKFSGEGTSFTRAHFSGERTDFTRAHFSGEGTSFSDAHFSGEGTDFTGAAFSGEGTSFSGAQFNGEKTDFSDAHFSGGWTSFSRTKFSGEWTSFSGAQFHSSNRTYFTRAQFSSEGTSFSDAHFSGGWTDLRAQFHSSNRTSFTRAQFNGERTSFSDAHFSGGWTDFTGAAFSGEGTSFSGAQFNGEKTDFSDANFSGEKTDFSDATFNNAEWTNFTGARFCGAETNFTGARFSSAYTAFRGAVLTNNVDFRVTTFMEKVEFWDTKIGHQAWVWFGSHIVKPELLTFHGVSLHPGWFINADVRKVDFTDVRWYGMPEGLKGTLDEEIQALEARKVEAPHTLLAQACRRLSSNAEENREYPLANEFHYWSMDALRKEGWNPLGLIGHLYWALSGYGVRAARAFWVLMGVWAAFTSLYVLVGPSEFKGFGQGIGYLWQAAVYSLLAMARLNPQPRPDEPGLFQFLVGLEGILGPLQIALLALAIRRKVMR